MPEFTLAVEICEDLWAPLPPSTAHALAGATVIANLSASDETVGKGGVSRSARLAAVGKASLRLSLRRRGPRRVDDRHGLLRTQSDCGKRRAAFRVPPVCGRLRLHGARPRKAFSERCRNTSFEPVRRRLYEVVSSAASHEDGSAHAVLSPRPRLSRRRYGARTERCELILRMQSDGLAKRMEHAHVKLRSSAFRAA